MLSTIISISIISINTIFRSISSIPKLAEFYKSTQSAKDKAAKNKALEILMGNLKNHHPDDIYFTAIIKQSENPNLVIKWLNACKWVQNRKTGNLLWTIRDINNPNADVEVRIPVSDEYNDFCKSRQKVSNFKFVKRSNN